MASQLIQKNIYSILSDDNETTDSQIESTSTDSQSQVVDGSISEQNDKTSPRIVPFSGRSVTPLVKVEEDLQYTSPKSVVKSDRKPPPVKGKKGKPKVIKFIASTSYIDEVRNNRRKYTPNRFSTKGSVSTNLTATKACKNVLTLRNGKYGVCERVECTFAHSLSELRDPQCTFDLNCRFRNGRPSVNGTIDSDAKCMFRHSDETRAEWLNRTGREIPNLPETSENTRKPSGQTHKPSGQTRKPSGQTHRPAEQTHRPAEQTHRPAEQTHRPSEQTHRPAGQTHRPSEQTHRPAGQMSSTDFSTEYFSGYVQPGSSLYTPNYFSNYHVESSRYDGSCPYRPLSPSLYRADDSSHLIRVPTRELAEMAITAAFDRGVYNIQVLIE